MKPFSGVTRNKIRDGFNGYSIFGRYGPVAHTVNVILEKINNTRVCQSHVTCSPFGSAVRHVVTSSSRGEMVRINTRWVIAGMHYMHSLRNFPVDALVREPMSKLFRSRTARSKKAVSFVVFTGLPIPAFLVGFYGNLGPKTFFQHNLSMMGYPSYVKG